MNAKEIERLILTNFRKNIFRPFTKAINDYKLVKENDHICVCISGGKDSFIMAKCMQELERHGKFPIKCEYIVMDPGYSEEYLQKIKENANILGVNIQVFKTDIFSSVKSSGHKSPCFICAKMRRGTLYSIAQNLGCNKIALGHHFDDVIETTLLSMFYNGVFNTMVPKVNSENFAGMQMIRPLYLVREQSIISFANKIGVNFTKCNCPLKNEDSKRKEVKKIINNLKETNETIDYNIFKASENVDINHIRGYIDNDKHLYFNDLFEEK